MKMAPAVNSFIRNKEYERPDKTTLQKGADILGKIALAGGTLAAAHAIGGGFKGNAAQKVAEAVGTAAVGKDFGISGGGTSPYTNYPSGGDLSGNVNLDGAVKAVTDTVLASKPTASAQIVSAGDKTDAYLARLNSPPVRPPVSGEQLPINAFNIPEIPRKHEAIPGIHEHDKKITKIWDRLSEAEKQMQAQAVYGTELTQAERKPLHREYDNIQRDQRLDDYPGAGSTQEAVDQFLQSRYQQAAEGSLRGIPLKYDKEGMVVRGEKGSGQLQSSSPLHPLPLNTPSDTPPNLSPTDIVSPSSPEVMRLAGSIEPVSGGEIQQREASQGSGLFGGFLRGQRQAGINTLDTISRQGGGRDLRKSAPTLAGAIVGRGLVPNTGGGLLPGSGTGVGRGAVKGFWDAAGNFVRRDPIVDNAVKGLEKIGDVSLLGLPSVGETVSGTLSAIPGFDEAVSIGGVKTAELAGLGAGVVVDSALKDTLKLGVDSRRFLENKFGMRPLSWQETANQSGRLLNQGWYRDEAAKIAARNNPLLAEGMARHDAAMSSLESNLRAALPTTVPTGQVMIGENHQLTRLPKLQPGDATMKVPSRAIQQFSDEAILGEGSSTPDDLEIRTDIDVSDPVNITSGFYDTTKRPSKLEKHKFLKGLRESNKDIYESASDLPERRTGKGYKWGTDKRSAKSSSTGQAASLSGTIDYPSADDELKDPLWQLVVGATEPNDDRKDWVEKRAEERASRIGRRIAEEEQSKIFDDPWGDS
jgi:hypothetical protein